ncbi:MAG: Na(+)-translocating NADH-quinone reductase subunit A [Bacteroidetes bacterium]|nr:Na(+)-translocating NADH-quinone reductase subunit A [Bacteroidota bacterium]
MAKTIHLKKGLNIQLLGEASKTLEQASAPETVMIKPTDFVGIKPKTLVQAGDEVLAGTPLFFDKNNPAYRVVSPVSGEVVEVVRGPKRVLLGIKILADKTIRSAQIPRIDAEQADADALAEYLCAHGAWAFIRTKPYDAVAFPDIKPKAVVVPAFDSAPLAPSIEFLLEGKMEAFQKGLDVLSKVSGAPVYLTTHAKSNSAQFGSSVSGVEHVIFDGPHPSGNVSVQMHHISPINKGEFAWYVQAEDVARIGTLVAEGRFDGHRRLALVGSSVENPVYVDAIQGSSMASILKDRKLQSTEFGNRIISGNVLTGDSVGEEGYLGFYHHQVTIIPEGKHREFFGWAAPGFDKFSLSRTFFSWLTPSKKYALTTNMHGEHRAFVVTGEYEKVFPMDIYPVQLLKAIHTGDIEMQENLGIYEVSPEDFALCEFACTSKIESQSMVRAAHDLLYGELVDSRKEPVHH